MIIDCHGHYTTAPSALGEYRDKQLSRYNDDLSPVEGTIEISDDEIRSSLASAQLQRQRERGTDLTIFSPRASWMGHHLGDRDVNRDWAERCNDLIGRVCSLFPQSFAPAAQLPQAVGESVADAVVELRRCADMGFVGCNVNPDPSGGRWAGPTLSDRYWYPLYEALCELEMPAMVHVTSSCNEHFHTTSSHYLSADTVSFMQLAMSSVFRDFPELRVVIPHGGGAVPYHWGRYRGILHELGVGDLDEIVHDHLFFDTCVYHQAGIDLLCRVVAPEQILFGSEMIGAVRGIDPQTDFYFDDTLRYIDSVGLSEASRRMILAGNALRVYPRLSAWMDAHGQA